MGCKDLKLSYLFIPCLNANMMVLFNSNPFISVLCIFSLCTGSRLVILSIHGNLDSNRYPSSFYVLMH